MPPASTDYAVMRERATAETKQERNAGLILTRQADTRLTAGSSPGGMITILVFLASLVATGAWIRHLTVPDWQEAAAACAFLLVLAAVIPRTAQADRRKEPEWARAAAVHEQALSSRAPAATLALVRKAMAKMTISTGWRAAHLYVSPCTEQDGQSPHYGPCCAGATWVRSGRLLVILGEHLLAGEPELALATLGHERRHLNGWRLYLYSIGSTAGTFGLVVAAWAVPWPALLLPVAALRVVSTLTAWAVELGCDVGSARELGADAMTASVNYKERTRRGARAGWPPAKRLTVSVLTWVTGPEHPPYGMRRAAIRAFAR